MIKIIQMIKIGRNNQNWPKKSEWSKMIKMTQLIKIPKLVEMTKNDQIIKKFKMTLRNQTIFLPKTPQELSQSGHQDQMCEFMQSHIFWQNLLIEIFMTSKHSSDLILF